MFVSLFSFFFLFCFFWKKVGRGWVNTHPGVPMGILMDVFMVTKLVHWYCIKHRQLFEREWGSELRCW